MAPINHRPSPGPVEESRESAPVCSGAVRISRTAPDVKRSSCDFRVAQPLHCHATGSEGRFPLGPPAFHPPPVPPESRESASKRLDRLHHPARTRWPCPGLKHAFTRTYPPIAHAKVDQAAQQSAPAGRIGVVPRRFGRSVPDSPRIEDYRTSHALASTPSSLRFPRLVVSQPKQPSESRTTCPKKGHSDELPLATRL